MKEKAPLILAEIKKANSILLHCHPSPDPDSVGSALAMKFALEQIGKKVTVIAGDSKIPEAFMHFPGAKDIVPKNYFEIDATKFDIFIIVDASRQGVSRMGMPVEFPQSMKVINIDHHKSNIGGSTIDLILPNYSSCAELLYSLFKEWNIKITTEIASDLFMGMYSDSGGFKYEGTTPATYGSAAELVKLVPDFYKLISTMENSTRPAEITFQALGLSNIKTFLGGKLALAVISYDMLVEKGIERDHFSMHSLSSYMRTVIDWDIVGALVEVQPGMVKGSFRTRNADVYDVSKLAVSLGGGGHKAAAGLTIQMPIEDAVNKVVAEAKKVYNL